MRRDKKKKKKNPFDMFDDIKDNGESDGRTDKEISPDLENIIVARKGFFLHEDTGRNAFDYENLAKKLDGVRYGEMDINAYIQTLDDLHLEENSEIEGMFVTALIDNLIDSKAEFQLNPDGKRFDYLGIKLSEGKKIIVHGDVGDKVGYKLSDAEIFVKGNCKNEAGFEMTDGNLVIEGNSGSMTGYQQRGGNLRVYGNIFSWGIHQGGRRYEKGNLIAHKTYKKDKVSFTSLVKELEDKF